MVKHFEGLALAEGSALLDQHLVSWLQWRERKNGEMEYEGRRGGA